MEEAVVGAVVGSTIQVLIENLISFSMEKLSHLFPDFKDDLEMLIRNSTRIRNILCDVEKKQVTSRAVKQWLMDLEDVAFEAYNVLDELDYERLHEEHNNMENPTTSTMMGKTMSLLSRPFKKAKTIFSDPRRELGQKIKDINKKLDTINQEAKSFGLHMGFHLAHASAAACSDASAGSETNSFTVDPIFIGRDNDVLKIVEMLTRSPAEQVFSILPVVGMGGLGKTTLTRKVFNHEKIKTHFGERRIWVHVPENFDTGSLLKKILTTLKSEEVEVRSSEVILKQLQGALGDKTYFLVLDDVWDQDRLKWEGFINSLSGISSVKGNGIIITTRIGEVASMVKTLDIHQLSGLSEEDCWSIIQKRAFEQRDSVPSDFEIIGRNIAKRCQGLPLAANVMGGVLRGKSKDEWLSIEKNWLSDVEGDENNITKILKLSFNHLSSPSLKKCFVYCSVFPRGAHIVREELVELWMAEGFLQQDQRNAMETVGNNFFNLLLQNSLLQAVQSDDYGNITCCSMHDLVHDVACSVLGSSKVNDNISDGIYKVRYVGHTYDRDQSNPFPKEEAKCLRTLFFKGEITDAMFSNFKSLHVLTLMDYKLTELPSSIRKLIHLRYLDISRTNIERLPKWIGELCHLQTLRSYRRYYHRSLRKLPSTLKYLINLRHLHIDIDVELPSELGRLTSLQTLPYFKVEDKKGHRIVELGSLENLKGKLVIHNLENVRNKEEAMSAHLFQKPNLSELIFQWNESREGGTNDYESVLEGLQPHPNLKSLKIDEFMGTRFPKWTLKMAVEVEGRWVALNKLVKLELRHCEECEEIPMLGHLPHLESLCLWRLTKVKSIGSSSYGNSYSNNGVINVFPALKTLELQDMSNLKEWAEVEFLSVAENQPCEVKVFPCLEYLCIGGCSKLMSAPSHFPCLKELKIRKMDSGLPLANICSEKLTSLTKLKIWKVNGLERLPDWLLYNNQSLSELRVEKCPNLKSIPYSSGGQSQAGFTSLRSLEILDCEGLINIPNLHTLNSLEKSRIENCPNLKSILYSSGGQSHGVTSLRSLRIIDCEGLINIPNLHAFNSLEELMIRKCPNLKSIPYSSDGQSQGFTSLRRLTIWDCEGLINLPCEMVELCAPSLESLWLGNLISVRNLPTVINCLQKMSRLRDLIIANVPKLVTTSSMGTGFLRSLDGLSIAPSSDSSDYVSFKETLDGILQASQSLRTLNLIGMAHSDSLPEQLQHLTSLSGLRLENFGIETLPEWLGNLSSLKGLDLHACKKLRCMASEEAMRRLTKLTVLSIADCPLLKQRCNEKRSDDSEWPKISHIPQIYMDFHIIQNLTNICTRPT